ncbi:MAG: hypothetical protein GX923_09385 [Clostridia bacterium]|jgi:hypothetical protein|nr:hypothetical protein [Clostridia bacterium]
MRNSRLNQKLTLNKITNQGKNNPTNNEIFDNVFKASIDLLHEDTEFSIELSDETAFPRMSHEEIN